MGEGKLKKKDESWIFKAVAVEFLWSPYLFFLRKKSNSKNGLIKSLKMFK